MQFGRYRGAAVNTHTLRAAAARPEASALGSKTDLRSAPADPVAARADPGRQRRALILCGGGARGAMEVGFYQAITELGLSFDLVVGSSVGALNGALIAAGFSPAELAGLWRGIRRRGLIAWSGRALLSGGFYSFDPLRRLLEKTLPVRRFEELERPLVITTTNLRTGHVHYWDRGDLLAPLIASMSLPGAFPPVWIGGEPHVDGGVASNVPFEPAFDRGITEMMLVLCTCCPPAAHPPHSPFGVLLRSFLISLDSKYACDLNHYRRQGIVMRLVRPEFRLDVGLLDFQYADVLIRAGHEQSLNALPCCAG